MRLGVRHACVKPAGLYANAAYTTCGLSQASSLGNLSSATLISLICIAINLTPQEETEASMRKWRLKNHIVKNKCASFCEAYNQEITQDRQTYNQYCGCL